MATEVAHSYVDVATGTTLDAWFPGPGSTPARSCLAEQVGIVRGEVVEIEIGPPDEPPRDILEAYHRLHLLSRGDAAPHDLNLDGLFGLLTNVAWTTAGPVLPERVAELRARAAEHHSHVLVTHVDKFPRMVDYVIPDGVRIGDADRVRLGAHLAPGTTVMHEGFVNFNAGTLGPVMVEGRITAGSVVHGDSDIGGGASIQGTLSGGGTTHNSIGSNSLLGANAGVGISLGDRCIVEAGLYLTAGTKVRLHDGTVVQARELSGRDDLLYRRNSQTGVVEAVPSKTSNWGGLNTDLHKN